MSFCLTTIAYMSPNNKVIILEIVVDEVINLEAQVVEINNALEVEVINANNQAALTLAATPDCNCGLWAETQSECIEEKKHPHVAIRLFICINVYVHVSMCMGRIRLMRTGGHKRRPLDHSHMIFSFVFLNVSDNLDSIFI